MKFSINRDAIIRPLQSVTGVVERRHSLPVLGNLLISARDGRVKVVGSDMEVEIETEVEAAVSEAGSATIPARKLAEICRALPGGTDIRISVDGERAKIHAGRGRYELSTLPAGDFPVSERSASMHTVALPADVWRRLLGGTQFAMAQQDVRYFLNGLLLEVEAETIRTVATDGHRLALCEESRGGRREGDDGLVEVIVPRKGVLEWNRLLSDVSGEVEVEIGTQSIAAQMGPTRLSSKLVDGKFPDYERVIPAAEDCDRHMVADREDLRHGLLRAAILSNEKYRAVRLHFEEGLARIVAHNPEQEQAEEEVEVEFEGAPLDIGFNVAYLIEVLGEIPEERVRFEMKDGNSSSLVRGESSNGRCLYVVMPMRL